MLLVYQIVNVKKYLLQSQYRRIYYRLIILAALFAIYAIVDWGWLNNLLRQTVIWSLSFLGHDLILRYSNISETITVLVDNKMPLTFVTGCTYLHLAFLLVPFLWRFDKPLMTNIGVSSFLIATILILNVARVALVIHFSGNSYINWFYIHSSVDILAHGGTLFPIISGAVKADTGAT